MPLLKRISIVGLAVVISGSVVYLFAVLPAHQELRQERVDSVARQVDAFVKVRAASLWAVTSLLDTENLRTDANTERSLGALREFCSDFLSLEVLDEQGEILAMLGDIPLSEAGRRGTSEDVKGLEAAPDSPKEWFSDDPENGSYYITTRHTARDGRKWFARGRFSRDGLQQTLASMNRFGTAHLAATAGVEPSVASSRTSEANLDYPGWSVVFEERAWSSRGSRKWEMASVSAALLATAILFLIRYGRGPAPLAHPGTGEKVSLELADEPASRPLHPQPEAGLSGAEAEPTESDAAAAQAGGDEGDPVMKGIAYESVPHEWLEHFPELESIGFHAQSAAEESPEAAATPMHASVTAEPAALDEFPDTIEVLWLEPTDYAQASAHDTDANEEDLSQEDSSASGKPRPAAPLV